jgi:hypothetical protein
MSTKINKIEDYLEMSAKDRKDALIALIGEKKHTKQNEVFNGGSNMPINTPLTFIGFDGRGDENDTIRNKTQDTRYIGLLFKSVNPKDKNTYVWAVSNAIADGRKVKDGELLRTHLRVGTSDKTGEDYCMIIADQINTMLPKKLDDLILYFSDNPNLTLRGKEEIYVLPFGISDPDQALQGKTVRGIYTI